MTLRLNRVKQIKSIVSLKAWSVHDLSARAYERASITYFFCVEDYSLIKSNLSWSQIADMETLCL